MSDINSEKIPNNVNLGGDLKLQRALEQWQPNFIDWWKTMGPEGFQQRDVYLRTAISTRWSLRSEPRLTLFGIFSLLMSLMGGSG